MRTTAVKKADGKNAKGIDCIVLIRCGWHARRVPCTTCSMPFMSCVSLCTQRVIWYFISDAVNLRKKVQATFGDKVLTWRRVAIGLPKAPGCTQVLACRGCGDHIRLRDCRLLTTGRTDRGTEFQLGRFLESKTWVRWQPNATPYLAAWRRLPLGQSNIRPWSATQHHWNVFP
jgi:hypothetical protein